MKRTFFTALEQHSSQEPLALSSVINELAFNEQGLIPVITQDANSNEILMFAWMNLDALKQTIATKRVTYWSRSRQQLWVKGDTSGHTQKLLNMSFDCDGDVILCQVEQQGAACHTGRTSCFYLNVDIEQDAVIVQGHKI
ncbi:MAG: phosphoribosyl-AMP cyclohydrolase [Oceanospirillaceae bacterium]|nr:phosphoribosyl-AMP cyclohydrolase [Oceanospirillaceae bacterium]HCI01828.1 phosphoribosyl-AMP cyclohydrolase [Oceanospirillaceae bacterium]|tara:strand:+ start:1270 stop:1689 length:420 start_codon:yes stop_codon:yes gene_type:complete